MSAITTLPISPRPATCGPNAKPTAAPANMPSRIRAGGEIRVKTDFFGDGSMIRLREVSKKVSGSCVMPPGLFSVERKSEIGRVDWEKPRNSFERTKSRKVEKGTQKSKKGTRRTQLNSRRLSFFTGLPSRSTGGDMNASNEERTTVAAACQLP